MNKLKFLVATFVVAVLTLGVYSCQKENLEAINYNPILIESRTDGNSINDVSHTREKGKFNNPYYIGTIKQACQTLYEQGKISEPYNDLQGNKLYLRYKPQNEDELYSLSTQHEIELFEYPLQENESESLDEHCYIDGSLDEEEIPWQYTVCGIGGIVPDYYVEILDTLYLNDPDTHISEEDWGKIEVEALISTQVLAPDDHEEIQALLFCNIWFPSGKIEAWDDNAGVLLPIAGAKIKVSRWFSFATKFTNSTGTFNFNAGFCGDVNYSIIWENSIWDIRNGKINQATTNGPKKRGPWNHEIRNNTRDLGFATCHRALRRYFYEDVEGLRRPYVGSQYLKLSYRHESGSALGWFSSSGFEGLFYSHVHIFGFNGSQLRPTQSIFSTTIHELAHVAHAFQIGNIQFWQVSNLIVESWARACQWKITELEYGGSPSGVPGAIQNWPSSGLNNYSPLFIDLVDSFNQNPSNNPNFPVDIISGYNLSSIQSNVLGHSYGLSSLRDRLKSQKPSGVTDAQIDSNLQFYFDNF